jgi:hypothetical protein
MKKLVAGSFLVSFAILVFLCGWLFTGCAQPVAATSTPTVLSDAEVAAFGKTLWVVNEKTGDKFSLKASLTSITNDSGKTSFRMTGYIFHMKKGRKSTSETVNDGTMTFYLLDADGKVAFGPVVETIDKMKPS